MTQYNCELPKVRVYKGARFVPKFADPLQWDKDSAYEWLTVVYNCGRTYISKQPVPAGVELPEYPILENDYWVMYADYNTQLEHYRAEVREFSLRYDEMFCWLKSEKERIENKFDVEVRRLDTRIDTLDAKVERYYTTLDNRITEEVSTLNERITTEVTTINNRITEEVSTLNQTINQVKQELINQITQLGDEINQTIQQLEGTSDTTFANILSKIYLGGTINESTGAITWPTADKIAIGNMNWYSGANNSNYIKTAADGDGDMRAE